MGTNFFLPDDPTESFNQDNDAFGHKYYSNSLFSIISQQSSQTPFVIGVFGKWGMGKTSIINDLRNQVTINLRNYKFITLDTWQYSDNNFRRDFLLDIAEICEKKKEVEKRLSKKYVYEDYIFPNITWQETLLALKQVGLFLLFFFIIYLPIYYITFFLPNSIFPQTQLLGKLVLDIASYFVAILLVFPENIKKIFEARKIVEESNPPIFSDEFKTEFDILINNNLGNYKKIIIVLDNLDRVKEDIVIQILSAIKTFLNNSKCVFILPCDQEGLIKHIVNSKKDFSSENQAYEYLRKFFNTTLSIKDILIEDLESYVNSITQRMEIFEESFNKGFFEDSVWGKYQQKNKDDVSYIFRVSIINNPRQIIQYANKLTANYLLAIERGRENISLFKNIITNLGFLAKITIIEDNWPYFYKMLTEDAEILRQIQVYLITEDDSILPTEINLKESNSSKEWQNGLLDFLRKTSEIHNEEVADFLFFRQSITRKNIQNFPKLIDNLLTRNPNEIKILLSSSTSNVNAIFSEIIRQLDKNRSKNSTNNLLSIIYCVCKLENEIPDEKTKVILANKIATILSCKEYEPGILGVGISDLLTLLHLSNKNQNIQKIINIILTNHIFIENESISQTVLSDISPHLNLFSDMNSTVLKNKIAENCKENTHLVMIRDFIDRSYEQDPKSTENIIPQEFFELSINEILKADYLENNIISLINNYQTLFKPNIFTILFKILSDQFSFIGPDLSQIQIKALKIISSINLDLSPNEETSNLLSTLVAFSNNPLSSVAEIEISKVFIDLIPFTNQTHRGIFMSSIVKNIPLFTDEDIKNLCKKIIEMREYLTEIHLIELINQISIKVTISSSPEIISIFFNLLVQTNQFEKIKVFIDKLWPSYEFSFQDFEQIMNCLPDNSQPDLILSLLSQTESLSPEIANQRLGLLGEYHRGYTNETRDSLLEELKNKWILSEDLNKINNSNSFLFQYTNITNKGINNLFSNVIQKIGLSFYNENPITLITKQRCSLVITNFSHLSKKNKAAFIKVVLELIEEGKPQDSKIYGFEILKSLIDDLYVQDETFKAIVSDIRSITTDKDNSTLVSTISDLFPKFLEPKKFMIVSELENKKSFPQISELIDSLINI
jgi:hypothetical protein